MIAAGMLAVTAGVVGRTASAQAAGANAPAPPLQYVAADVQFMQGMIHHHAQALQMVGLIADRTTNNGIHLLGQRIAISQRDEIGLMRRWLQDHHESVPTVDTSYDSAGHGGAMAGMSGAPGASGTAMPGMDMHGGLMPGMLTPDQMAQLAHAKGAQFDRLLLEGMIHHHEGALTMVAQLFHAQGATQDSDVFRFASDVDADQRAEIRRMQGMLAAMPGGAAGGASRSGH